LKTKRRNNMNIRTEWTKNRAIGFAGLAFAALGAFWAFADEPKTAPDLRYNPATVVDVAATVSGLRILPVSAPLEGVHLTAVSRTGNLDIYVAPAAFFRMLKVDFAKGDKVHVIGSEVKFENAEVLLVRDITNAHSELHLRDDAGEPVWTLFR
jgi:hypothetical protein